MTTLQEYLDQKYPTKEDKEKVTEIDILKINNFERKIIYSAVPSQKLDGGKLDLREYKNLQSLKVSPSTTMLKSPLTELNISGCTKLACVSVWDNQLTTESFFESFADCPNLFQLGLASNNLTSVDFLGQLPNPKQIFYLDISNNNIKPIDITIFKPFTNIISLQIGGKNNKFYGSSQSLKHLTELRTFNAGYTDVDSDSKQLVEQLETENETTQTKQTLEKSTQTDLTGEKIQQLLELESQIQQIQLTKK